MAFPKTRNSDSEFGIRMIPKIRNFGIGILKLKIGIGSEEFSKIRNNKKKIYKPKFDLFLNF